MAKERKSKPNVPHDEFTQRLTNAGLTKVRFAALTGMRRTNVARWLNIGAPAWTVTWLMLYTKATKERKNLIDQWADFTPQR